MKRALVFVAIDTTGYNARPAAMQCRGKPYLEKEQRSSQEVRKVSSLETAGNRCPREMIVAHWVTEFGLPWKNN